MTVRQAEPTECGLACLTVVLRAHGGAVDLNGMRARFGTSLQGVGLRDIMRMADELDLGTRALRLEPDGLKSLKLPAILHWDLNHFVVLTRVWGERATIEDPAKGVRTYSLADLGRHFTGVALELTPTADFAAPHLHKRMRLRDLWSRITGWKRAAVHLLALSFILQTAALGFPLFLQLTIDEAIVRFDERFLLVLVLGFAALHLINSATEGLRAWVILTLGQSLSFQMIGNVFHHLIRLPTNFFEKRHVGDIISRVRSTQPIQHALTQSVVATLIDGLMLIFTALFIFIYAWQLALVVVLSVLLYLSLSLALFPVLRAREEEEIATGASEQSHLMESMRAATTVKLFGREGDREGIWRNKFTEYINAGIRRGRLQIVLDVSKTLIFGLQTVLVVYLGARMIMDGAGLSVGMLFAFMAYRQQFADRAAALVQRGIEFRMLGLHLDRLSDIVQTGRESGLDAPVPGDRPLAGGIELDGVAYRYAPTSPFIFEDLCLRIEPGEMIAITGPSGGGKTTLLKVMLGLLRPERGDLRIDGVPLLQFGLRPWRRQTGVVSQDDQLLSGTIADNIAFFDPDMDMDKVRDCARAARIHDDVMAMPMGYLSLIGDMGAALSGGQRQRLLLARALYHAPKVLFLDEGTANLDEASEQQIADMIEALPMTRIIVAHRPELVRRANRVFEMRHGTLTERAPAGDIAPRISGHRPGPTKTGDTEDRASTPA